MDIGEFKRTRIRRSVERWLGLDVPIFVHSTLDGVGSREIRVLVQCPRELNDKKRVADAVIAGIQRPGARPRIRLILVDVKTKWQVDYERIRVLGKSI